MDGSPRPTRSSLIRADIGWIEIPQCTGEFCYFRRRIGRPVRELVVTPVRVVVMPPCLWLLPDAGGFDWTVFAANFSSELQAASVPTAAANATTATSVNIRLIGI